MRKYLWLAALLLLASGCQQDNSGRTALKHFRPTASLIVTLPDIKPGQPIPERFSGYGGNQTPTIHWGIPPGDTMTFLVLIEDTDAPGDKSYVHYIVYNIPASENSLSVPIPPIAVVGKNSNDDLAYVGPHPPSGSGAHHYHFEVLALSTAIAADPGATWEDIRPRVEGYVLAGGEAVATYTNTSH